jgi:hypothetical protein
MRANLGAPRGQKQRIIEFVGDRSFTVSELRCAVESGDLKDVVVRNIDRYVGTMCQTGQMERTGEKRTVGIRKMNVYRVTGAKAVNRPRVSKVQPAPESPRGDGVSHQTLFDIGKRFGTLT